MAFFYKPAMEDINLSLKKSGEIRMSIENLRTEVRQLCQQLVVNYIREKDASRYYLSANCPANVMNNNEVYVLDCIPEEDKIQAEAHELGHIYVREKGLISIPPNGNKPFDFLLLELNNALSHRFVLNVLSQIFFISNDLHLDLRAKSLNSIKQDIKDFKEKIEYLHAFGLKLYDIRATIPELKNEVERLIVINGNVSAAYNAAVSYIDPIQLETPKKEQESAINGFLIHLGYDRPDLCWD
jgi:hypothetical protein